MDRIRAVGGIVPGNLSFRFKCALDITILADSICLLVGGMWDVWHAKEVDRLYTFTVLTTFLNEVPGQIHDRMPVIVQAKDYERWLDPENEDVADILATPPSEGWIAYPVSGRVNSPKNDDAKLIESEAT